MSKFDPAVGLGITLFAMMLAAVISVGAALASSPMPFTRPPYVGRRAVLTNRGWVSEQVGTYRKGSRRGKGIWTPRRPL